MVNYSNKAVILGCSVSGLAAAHYLLKSGYSVFVSDFSDLPEKFVLDVNNLKKQGVNFEFNGHTINFLKGASFAVTSPSIPNSAPIYNILKDLKIEVISELDLAYRCTKNKDSFIGITGTNGKTTTTSAIAHLLSKKFTAPACGNIGKPPISFTLEKPDWYVTEVSSFQLEKSKEFRAHIACWTNFTPDHITWHGSMEKYFNAKAKMFLNQTEDDFAILNGSDKALKDFASKCPGRVFWFDKETEDNCSFIKNNIIYIKTNGATEEIIKLEECNLSGHHNYQNLMCAILVSKLAGLPTENIRTGLKTFTPPEHRMEKFAQFNGITFFNDSKATNPESSIAAIDAFNNQNVALIAGGRDKLTPLDDFCKSVNKHITSVILIGEAADRFEVELKNNGFKQIYKETSLQKAVDKCVSLKPDTILLSPACASFDMFSGYEERGKVFKDYVLSKFSNK